MGKTPLQKWLALYQRGAAGWPEIVLACVDEAAAHGPEKTVEVLSDDLVAKLRDEDIIKTPPAARFPIQAAAYYLPDTDFAAIDRDRCTGAKLLHDYFADSN